MPTPGATTAVPVVTKRYASQGFATGSSDSPALASVRGVALPSQITRRIDPQSGDGTFAPTVESTIGQVILDNTDRLLDADLLALVLEGCEVRVSVANIVASTVSSGVVTFHNASGQAVTFTNSLGQVVTFPVTQQAIWVSRPPEPRLADFSLAFRGTVSSWSAPYGQVVLRVEADTAKLDKPLVQSTYAGTGGVEGDANLKGVTKPGKWGFCQNAEPTLIDSFLMIYQVHDGPILDIPVVNDRGVPIAHVLDCDSYAELAALAPAGALSDDGDPIPSQIDVGEYAVWLDGGMFRTGYKPSGRVTCDVYGSGAYRTLVETFSDGTLFTDGTGLTTGRTGSSYVDGAAAVVELMLRVQGGLDPARIDSAGMLAATGVLQAQVGYSVAAGESRTVAQAVATIAASVNAVLPQGRDGQFQIRHLALPSGGAVVTIDDSSDDERTLELLELPWQQPWPTWRVGWGRNWTVMTDSDLAQEVVGTGRAFFLRASAYAEATDPVLALHYPGRGPATLEAVLAQEADALTVAQERLALYNIGRRIYQRRVAGATGLLDVGDAVVFKSALLGLSAGKTLMVAAVTEDVASQRTAIVAVG